jgi:glutamate carboxypeptidase
MKDTDRVGLVSDRYHDLLGFCESQKSWARVTLERLVRLESPSDDKAALDRCGAEVARQLTDIGADVTRFPQTTSGDHVRAIWRGPSGTSSGAILLLGHFDTVWPVGTLDRMPLREEDGRLYGPGVFDMKAGIVVSMLAVRALQQVRGAVPDLIMLWTGDEEVGSRTSRSLIEETTRASSAVLVLEPSLPGGSVKTSRKGVGEFEITVHGVSAHAGLDPGKGSSAIHELARVILALETLQDLERGISVNVGVVSGGSRPNVVADRATARVDVRVPTMEDAARVESAIRSLRPARSTTRLQVAGGVERPPLERSDGVLRLYEQARRVAASLGRELGEGAAGGGSDGNFTAAIGVPTLDGLGPEGDGAHAAHEHIRVDDLTWRGAFLAALLETLVWRPGGASSTVK